MIYTYTKYVINDVLKDMIILNDVLRPKFVGLNVSINRDNTVEDDNVRVEFTEILQSHEEDELIAIINNYSETHPFVERYYIKQHSTVPNQKFLMDFLLDFGANNVQRQKTPEQVGALMGQYSNLMMSCLGGSPTSVYAIILSMVADDNITQEEIDEYKKRLEIFMGLI